MNVTQPKLGSISAALSCLVRVPFPNSGWLSSLSQSQIRFLIGGELVKCQGSKLTNSPGWENLKNSLANQNLPAHDQVMHLETAAHLCTSRRQTNHFFAVFFSIFESTGITKHLMTGPTGNSELCFHWTLNVPVGFILRLSYFISVKLRGNLNLYFCLLCLPTR